MRQRERISLASSAVCCLPSRDYQIARTKDCALSSTPYSTHSIFPPRWGWEPEGRGSEDIQHLNYQKQPPCCCWLDNNEQQQQTASGLFCFCTFSTAKTSAQSIWRTINIEPKKKNDPKFGWLAAETTNDKRKWKTAPVPQTAQIVCLSVGKLKKKSSTTRGRR